MKRNQLLACCSILILATLCLQAGGPPAPPPARAIPGVTAPDVQARACVSCHIDMPDLGVDARLSTAMKRWAVKVEPKLLARVQGTLGPDRHLDGKHPVAVEALGNIPVACIDCHDALDSAPEFSRLMHAIHLTGGEENHFLTIFQGECTHCHKLTAETGEWTVPTGAEE